MTVFKPQKHDLLTTLALEQSQQHEGNRNVELFRRARVALEAGYEPDEVTARLEQAGLRSGLSSHEVEATLRSAARAERAERVPDGTPPLPSEEWGPTWQRTWPRVIAVDADKRPMQRWQYPWDEPNDATRSGGSYLSVVIPPGVLVLDVDEPDAFNSWISEADLAPLTANTHKYGSISGKPGKGHVWFRAHSDRPYPTRSMRNWPGADLLVGGMGIANVRDATYLDIIGDPAALPLAPDWMQPRASSRVQRIGDYLSGVPDHIPWIIDKTAFIHGLTIIAGQPKAGKSTLTFEMLRCRESGAEFLEHSVTPGDNLLVTEEGGVSIKFKADGLTELFVYDRKASAGEPFEATLGVIADWAADHPGGLIVIDTLAAWAGVEDENDSAEMQKAIDAIRLALAEPYEVAVILIHHARKGGGSHGEGIRGSGAILAAVDHVIELKRTSEKKGRENLRTLSIMSRVLRADEKWVADWNGERYTLAQDDEDDPSPDDLDALEADVARIPADGPGMVEKDTKLTWRRLNSLVGKGRVRKQDGRGKLPALYWGIPPVYGPNDRPSRGDEGDE